VQLSEHTTAFLESCVYSPIGHLPNVAVEAQMRLSVTAALIAFVAGTPLPASAQAWTLSFSTYFGGSDMTTATAVAVDGSGDIYVAGWTDSTSLPGCSPVRPNAGGVDAFVAKWDGTTHLIDYCTFLGGRGDDRALAIAVDASGYAYITGRTMSANFPVSGALQAVLAGAENAFVAKLNPAGGLVYSSYLGGNGSDSGNAVAVDSVGNMTVVGNTTSTNFPLASPIQSSLNGQTNVFVTRLSPAGDSLVYSTYLGGSGNDYGTAVALDGTGAAYLTGSTTSTNFPVVNAFQPISGGNQDAFVAKINSAGNSLVYSTYLGGSGGTVGFPETGSAIAVDSAGDAYVTGITSSPNFPLANALFSISAGVGIHAFVIELNPAGSGLAYSTYLGGSSIDQAAAIAVDSGGNAVVAGSTASPDFPLANPAQPSQAGGYDAFVTRLNSTGTALLESTFFGGSGSEAANAVAYDAANSVYIAGQTQSLDLPIEDATQPALAGTQSAFLAVFTLTTEVSTPPAPTTPNATAGLAQVTLTWTASSGATSYNVYRGTTAGGESATAIASGITTTSYFDAGVSNGTTYYYKVAAVNAAGTSALSGEASATPEPQSISFGALANRTVGTAPFTVSATASSGLAVSFNSKTTSVCTVSGSQVTLVAVGTCTIQATQAGNINYAAATPVNQSFQVTSPTISLDQNHVWFGATNNGAIVTAPQTVSVIAPAGVSWSVSSSLSYVVVSPTSGVGSGTFTISIQNTALSSPGNVNATVTVTVTGASNSPQYVNVSLNVINAGATAAPFGSFDTPANNATGLAASVAVTGWALDAIGVQEVQIWRDPLSGETPTSNGLIYIGAATFVPGARPDVQASYPNYPLNNRAGWGYLMLTNGLPNNGGSAGTGNGTYTLHAIATSTDGNTVALGSKTITCDNADATTPFGAIDTPGQGATVSGTIVNFGWALTPQPYSIPIDGSTIWVTVDGQYLGHPVYNNYRSDIATGFPGYNNTSGAVGYFYLDTTTLSNGMHNIGWLVTDNDGRANGIGSRFIWVLN
jgi:hypothetical protein